MMSANPAGGLLRRLGEGGKSRPYQYGGVRTVPYRGVPPKSRSSCFLHSLLFTSASLVWHPRIPRLRPLLSFLLLIPFLASLHYLALPLPTANSFLVLLPLPGAGGLLPVQMQLPQIGYTGPVATSAN